MLSQFDGLLWLLLMLGPLIFLQGRLHHEVQAVFLLLTRRSEIAIFLFSLLFFPGVMLHEGSHYLMARLLGVRTGRFSILPRDMKDGRLQLGFVETAQTDFLRDALIGAAPLLTGGLFVAYSGLVQLNLSALWPPLMDGDVAGSFVVLGALPEQTDFWLWLYLTIAVSSTMLPSASDRRAWPALGLIFGGLLLLALLAGAGEWMLANLAPTLNNALRSLALVFSVGTLVHLALLPPLVLLRRGLSRLMGLQVV
jgi:hypothetical protein